MLQPRLAELRGKRICPVRGQGSRAGGDLPASLTRGAGRVRSGRLSSQEREQRRLQVSSGSESGRGWADQGLGGVGFQDLKGSREQQSPKLASG